MKHTLETLLKLADTDDGRQQIRVIVTELVGYVLIPWQEIDFYFFQPTEHGRALAKNGELIGALRDYDLPAYHTSLDAIMPEVRKLDEEAAEKWANFMADLFYRKGNLGRQVCYAIATAEAIHHCIAFILTKQKP